MAEEKKNPLIGAFRSAPAKDQEPPGSKAAEPEKAVVLSKEKAKPAEKPVEKKAEKSAPAAAKEKPGKAEEKPVAAPAEKKEKKPEEKPSTGAVKQEDKKAAASAKAEEKKPAEDKGAEDMPESKKETEKKDQTDADGIPEDFRLNIVGEGALGSVVMLPVEKIDDFEGHPFPVQDDKDMLDLVESIKKFGVLEPVTVIRSGKDPERYEMVAGHRRKHGCALAGVAQIPAIVRDMDRDSAIIYMVDSNLKRENISPMVKARAYTMKLEAMKRKAGHKGAGGGGLQAYAGRRAVGLADRGEQGHHPAANAPNQAGARIAGHGGGEKAACEHRCGHLLLEAPGAESPGGRHQAGG